MFLRTLAASLTVLALAAEAGATPQDFKATVRGDLAYSYAVLPQGSGTLAPPAGIPAGAEIVSATLYLEYWARWSGGASDCGNDPSARFQNAMVQIGSDAAIPLSSLPNESRDCGDFLRNGGNCALNVTLRAHRIDLRPVFAEGQPIGLSGFPVDSIGDTFATLFVVYCSSSEPVRDIVILEDLQIDTTGPGRIQFPWSGLRANGDEARLLLAFGDAEQRETVLFNGTQLGSGTGGDGIMDNGVGYRGGFGVDDLDVSSLVDAGDDGASLDIDGLCFYVHVVAMSVTTDDEPGRLASFGRAVAGSGGLEPTLSFTGCPVAGGEVRLDVSQVIGGAPGCLLIGEGRASRPYLCGEGGVGTRLFERGHVAAGPLGQAGAGSASWTFRVPLAFIGRAATFQVGYLDPGACGGVSLSQTYELEVGG